MASGKKSLGDNSEQEGNSKRPANPGMQAKSNPQGQSRSTEAKEIPKEARSSKIANNLLTGNVVDTSNLQGKAPTQEKQKPLAKNAVDTSYLKRETSNQGENASKIKKQILTGNAVDTSNLKEKASKEVTSSPKIANSILTNNAVVTSNLKEDTSNSSKGEKNLLTSNTVDTPNLKGKAPKPETSSSDSGQKANVVKGTENPPKKGLEELKKAKSINK